MELSHINICLNTDWCSQLCSTLIKINWLQQTSVPINNHKDLKLAMVALKIFDVLIQAAHVYTVHFMTDRNSKAALYWDKKSTEPFGNPTL